MADWSKPVTTDTYSNVLSYINARLNDIALGLDPAITSPTNVPTNAIRWNSASYRFEKWNGTAWSALISNLTITGTLSATIFNENGTNLSSKYVSKITSTANKLVKFSDTSSTITNSIITDDGTNITLPTTAQMKSGYGNLTNPAFACAENGYGMSAYNGYTYLLNSSSGFKLRYNNTTDLVTVDSAGNVGVGVTPSAWFSVFKAIQLGGASGTSGITGQTNVPVIGLWANAYNDSGNTPRYITSGNYAIKYIVDGYTGQHQWFTAPSGTAGNAISWTTAMILDASSNLEIRGKYSTILTNQGSISTPTAMAMIVDNYKSSGMYSNNNLSNSNAVWLSWKINDNANNLITAMTLDASGNLGLGVAPNSWTGKAIEVGYAGDAVFGYASGNINLTSGCYYNSGWKYATTSTPVTYYNQSSGSHSWFTAPSGTAGNAISFTTAMTLDAGGNLLVGTTSNNGRLSIYGGSVSSSTYIADIRNGSYTGLRIRDDGYVFMPSTYNKTTASASNMFIDSDGALYRSTSSRKYKTNIENIDSNYVNTFFDNARPIYYKSLSENDNPNWGYWGFIAEEIAEFDKRLVYWRYDTKQVEVEKERVIPAVEEIKDEDGNITQEAVAESTETYTEIETVNDLEAPMIAEGVMYERIVVLLTAKVQELEARLKALEAK